MLSAITDPSVARRILECLKLPPRAPPLEQASKPGPSFYIGLGFDAEKVSTDEADPGFEFDQSLPGDD